MKHFSTIETPKDGIAKNKSYSSGPKQKEVKKSKKVVESDDDDSDSETSNKSNDDESWETASESDEEKNNKNGTDNTWLGISSTSTVREISGSSLIYFNGSTDYVEIYVYIESSGATLNGSSTQNWFTGALVRSA